MKVKKVQTKDVRREIKFVLFFVSSYALMGIFCFVVWLWTGAPLVSMETLSLPFGGIVFLSLAFLGYFKTVRDYERYLDVTYLNIANDTREQMIQEFEEQHQRVDSLRKQGKAYSDKDEIVILKAMNNSLILELNEYKQKKNPWRDWFRPACAAMADIIRAEQQSKNFIIVEKDFRSSMIAHHGIDKKEFGSAISAAWKCVPDSVKHHNDSL